jgi:hypothetical protein
MSGVWGGMAGGQRTARTKRHQETKGDADSSGIVGLIVWRLWQILGLIYEPVSYIN